MVLYCIAILWLPIGYLFAILKIDTWHSLILSPAKKTHLIKQKYSMQQVIRLFLVWPFQTFEWFIISRNWHTDIERNPGVAITPLKLNFTSIERSNFNYGVIYGEKSNSKLISHLETLWGALIIMLGGFNLLSWLVDVFIITVLSLAIFVPRFLRNRSSLHHT